MLPASLDRLLTTLADDALVVDIGGWAAPVNRADWVIDLMPYETRGQLPVASFGPLPERFSADTWVQRDLCGHEPYPFPDDHFDFAVCTYTLEDVRDPVRVCQEMSRIARAGLIEVPSLADELSWHAPAFSGGPWVGHDHHRWLCFASDGEIEFMHKPHSLHAGGRATLPGRAGGRLSPEERAQVLGWEGELRASERVVIGAFPLDELADAVAGRARPLDRARHRVRRVLDALRG